MKVVADRSCGKQNDPRNHWAGFVTLLCVPTGQARSREGYTIARSGCLRNFVILVEVSALCFSFDQGHRNRSIHLLRVIATKREQFENTIQDEERVASHRPRPRRNERGSAWKRPMFRARHSNATATNKIDTKVTTPRRSELSQAPHPPSFS